jgi:hypothetical protein
MDQRIALGKIIFAMGQVWIQNETNQLAESTCSPGAPSELILLAHAWEYLVCWGLEDSRAHTRRPAFQRKMKIGRWMHLKVIEFQSLQTQCRVFIWRVCEWGLSAEAPRLASRWERHVPRVRSKPASVGGKEAAGTLWPKNNTFWNITLCPCVHNLISRL